MNPFRVAFKKLSAALLVLGALLAVPSAEAASDGPYRMEVLVNGRPAPEYWHKGATYIEAKRGLEYTVRLSNMTGERVAVALSVDGMNSIDARHTSAVAARKWILGPYESIVVNGWQTSSATSRQFYFTGEASSYGAWKGDTRNLGNISAAFFREDRPAPQPYYEPYRYNDDYEGEPLSRRNESREKRSADAAAPSAEAARSGAGMASKSAPSASRAAPVEEDLAATGIGRERSNRVYQVEFRQESTPAAVMTVRYEFRDKLIQMGILPRPYRPDPMHRRENSGGFTDYGYAPDPYRR